MRPKKWGRDEGMKQRTTDASLARRQLVKVEDALDQCQLVKGEDALARRQLVKVEDAGASINCSLCWVD